MEKLSFYPEWIGLEKEPLELLVYLRLNGSFDGNLSSLCKELGVSSKSSKNIEKLKSTINELKEKELISTEKCGRTHTLKIIEKESVLPVPKVCLDLILSGKEKYSKPANMQVLRVYLYYLFQGKDSKIYMNGETGDFLGISENTVSSANTALEKIGIILRETIRSVDEDGEFATHGVKISVGQPFS